MITLVRDTIDNKDVDRLVDWLKTYPRLSKGPVTLEFEKKYSNWLGTKYSVFVNSGSSANLLMLSTLKQGDYLKNNKIVVPSTAWATDLAPVIQLGLEPIYKIEKNPLTWLDTMLNAVEHMNFFEGRATEYSKASTRGSWTEAFS